MERDFREAKRDMPYHRRHDGLSAGEVFEMEQLTAFLNDLITRADNLPPGRGKDFFLLVILLLFQAMLLLGSVERRNLVPVNRENRNRVIESFTDEECWHYLRFRKPELHRLFIVTDIPQEVRCENGVTCLGEYAFFCCCIV